MRYRRGAGEAVKNHHVLIFKVQVHKMFCQQRMIFKGFKRKDPPTPGPVPLKKYALPGNQLRCYQTLDLSSLRPFLRLARILGVFPREKICKLDFLPK